MMKIKAIIFDLDGTLADTLPLCIRAFRESVQPLIGRTVSDEEIIATFGPSEEGTIMTLAPGRYHEGIAAYLHHYASLHHLCPAPFDGMRALLAALAQKGIRLALVTGKGRHSTAISLEYFGLSECFSIVETGSPDGPRKAQGIQAVLAGWPEIDKSEVVYLGDAPSDITVCRAVGVPIVAAAWASTADAGLLGSMGPDAVFATVEDFRDWVDARW